MEETGKQKAVYTDMKSKCELQEPRNHVALFGATIFFCCKMEGGNKKRERQREILLI
jgi:hypothetical protein